MPKETSTPTLVGCELIIRKGDSILLGKRKNVYGAGTWALPGGHLEFNEKLVSTICREAKEELNATIRPDELKLVSIVDDLQPENDTHYVHVSFELRDPKWDPQIAEPDHCEEWRYFPLGSIPDNFFTPHKGIIENYLTNRLYAY